MAMYHVRIYIGMYDKCYKNIRHEALLYKYIYYYSYISFIT